MSNLYWAFIGGAAVCFVLGTLEHFASQFVPSVGWFLLPIASARAFLSLANFCLLFAIALAVGAMMSKQQAQNPPAEPDATD